MQRNLFIVLLLFYFPITTFALENRLFLTWHGKDVDEINKLEDILSETINSNSSTSEIKSIYDNYKNMLNDKCTSFGYHLRETLLLAENLANDEIKNEEKVNDLSLELRNRIGTIYHDFWLRFAPAIEEELLNHLHKIALNQSSSYAKMEAIMAIEIIGNKRSLEILEKALIDSDELVKECAEKALINFKKNSLFSTTYIEYLKEFKKYLKEQKEKQPN